MIKKISTLFCALVLVGCETIPTSKSDMEDGYNLKPISFSQINGWSTSSDESLGGFIEAFSKSCRAINKKQPDAAFGNGVEWGTVGQWQSICLSMPSTNIASWAEQTFQPMAVTNKANERDGLFTGYYEASLNGSKMKTRQYNIPLREKPRDLVSVNLGQFRDDLKGKRIAGRVIGDQLKPYEDRSEIVTNKMPLKVDRTLMWVDSPVDAFFLEIQGSGMVQMADGSTQRVGYAGQNGHKYTAIGRTLIDMGELQKENVSMQSIRAWLEANPAKAQDIMNSNQSYVFFRSLNTDGPVGAQGVTLTPNYSLAVDRGLYPYGLPVWLDAQHPDPAKTDQSIQRLMVAQDTGGAIKGAVRGDVFWGYGKNAEEMAGLMKSNGTMVVFVPR